MMPQNDMPSIAAGEMVEMGRPEGFLVQVSIRLTQSPLQTTLNHMSEGPFDAGHVTLSGPGEKAEEMAHVAKRMLKILMED